MYFVGVICGSSVVLNYFCECTFINPVIGMYLAVVIYRNLRRLGIVGLWSMNFVKEFRDFVVYCSIAIVIVNQYLFDSTYFSMKVLPGIWYFVSSL